MILSLLVSYPITISNINAHITKPILPYLNAYTRIEYRLDLQTH